MKEERKRETFSLLRSLCRSWGKWVSELPVYVSRDTLQCVGPLALIFWGEGEQERVIHSPLTWLKLKGQW